MASAFGANRVASLKDRMGIDPKALSPIHHVTAGAPPPIIFHGTADTTTPLRTAERFTRAMRTAGIRCRLVPYEGMDHGFFNYGRDGNKMYLATLGALDEFLVDLGYLQRKPVAVR